MTGAESGVLRLLVDDRVGDPDAIDLVEAGRLAQAGGVVVRLADVLHAHGDGLPPGLGAAAAAACARTQRALAIVDRLGDRCAALGLSHAIVDVAERYPDSGRVVLLVDAPPSAALDRAILRDTPARAAPRRGVGLHRQLAGSSTYVAQYGIQIRVRHGRVGRFGEHAWFARRLLERARPQPVGRSTCRVATPEDYFLLLAIERAYARPGLRLADLAWIMPLLRRTPPALAWDYVFATALACGVVSAISGYLSYVDGEHRRLFRNALVPDDVRRRFGESRRRSTTARTFLRQVGATIESGRWHSAARLSFAPVLAALAGLRRTA